MKPTRKICVVCGRKIQWRKKWRSNWQRVKYCSRGCQKNGLRDIDRALEKAIMTLLHSRAASSSICPSEAAIKCVGHLNERIWRSLLENTRRAARRLAHRNKIEILQAGVPVDPARFKGPIRLKLKR